MASERKKTPPKSAKPFLTEYAPIPGAPMWLRILLPSLVAVAAFVAFLPALDAGFVNWDDDKNILNNPDYRGLAGKHLKWMFETTKMGHWQPLSWISLALDYQRHGGGDPAAHPRGYHLTNMLLHAGGAVAFYFLALRLLALACDGRAHGQAKSGRGAFAQNLIAVHQPGVRLRLGAALAALFFAVHPLRVEAVAWVTERRDVLSGLFFIATINAYLISRTAPRLRTVWYVASILLLVLSVLSKAWGMTMPAILLVLDWYPLRRLGSGPLAANAEIVQATQRAASRGSNSNERGLTPLRPSRNGAAAQRRMAAYRVIAEKLPFALIAVAVAVKAKAAQAGQLETLKSLEEHGVLDRIAQAFYGLAFYVYKTTAPFNLIPIYEIPQNMNPLALRFVICAVAVIVAAALLFCFRRRWPAGVALAVCYLAIFSPVSGIAQSGPQLVKDSYTYLCCLSWAVLVGGLLIWIGRRWGAKAFTIGGAAGAVVIAALGMLTWRQAAHWRDSKSLWTHTLAVDRYCWNALNNMAILLKSDGDLQGAADLYQRSLAVHPRNAEALYNRGNCLKAMKRYDEAIASYLAAIEAGPDPGPAADAARLNLANTYRQFGQLEKSIPQHACVAARKNDPQLYEIVAEDLRKSGREERSQLYAVLSGNPRAVEPHLKLVELLLAGGECAAAKSHAHQAWRLRPQDTTVQQALARVRSQCP